MVDTLISRVIDALLAFPSILLALVVIAALGPSIQNVMIAVGVATVPHYARLVRGSVLSIKQLPYVEAARVVGNPPWRIMLRHVLANAYAPVSCFRRFRWATPSSSAPACLSLGSARSRRFPNGA